MHNGYRINAVNFYFDNATMLAMPRGSVFTFDVECFENYFLAAFRCYVTGKIIYYESLSDRAFDIAYVDYMLTHFTLVGFNCKHYDLVILAMALAGHGPRHLKAASDDIIVQNMNASDLQKKYNFKMMPTNSIDLIDVAPLRGSLKLYAARLHAKHLQDLPFDPATVLTNEQIDIVREYCFNDLVNTELLLKSLNDQLELRVALSKEYKQDLRSKSDAQIAETVIVSEIVRMTGKRPKQPRINPEAVYRYIVPTWMQFQTSQLQAILANIATASFKVREDGVMIMPPALLNASACVGNNVYRMGIGGLHSSEKEIAHTSQGDMLIIDRDVASYYPAIILNLGLYPDSIGPDYLTVYRTLVERRMQAKKQKNYIVAENLKIAVNGSFGKSGSPYSVLYAPNMLVQITVTGQLALLMLIEQITLAGFNVISANTDGVISKISKCQHTDFNKVIEQWEIATGFTTEETLYDAVYSRDVNNYIATMADGSAPKTKGAYSNPWDNPKKQTFILQKNPQAIIVNDAAVAMIVSGTPVSDTIRNCGQIERFVVVRSVTGGAQKDGRYLGKIIRWYYAKGTIGCIEYCNNGHKVNMSDGGKPLMTFSDKFPNDINYEYYIKLANDILFDVAFAMRKNVQLSFLTD